jgi:hypothetical protein
LRQRAQARARRRDHARDRRDFARLRRQRDGRAGGEIDNATAEYPNGDTVQVVEPWAPPSAWADTTPVGLNAILSDKFTETTE